MDRYYDKWNEIKKQINKNNNLINFNEKDIFMAYVGQNIGFEQNGDKNKIFLRPVLIYKKFNKNLFLGIPLTKTQKDGKFYYKFKFKKDIISTAILSQIKLMDSKRLKYRMGKIKHSNYIHIALKFESLIKVTP